MGWLRIGIDPAPAAVAPRREPARALWQVLRDEIQARSSKRMTSAEACERHPASRPQSKPADCLISVVGAAGKVTAVDPDERRDAVAIGDDECPGEQPACPPHVGGKTAMPTRSKV